MKQLIVTSAPSQEFKASNNPTHTAVEAVLISESI